MAKLLSTCLLSIIIITLNNLNEHYLHASCPPFITRRLPLRPIPSPSAAADIVIRLTFDIFIMPDFDIPSINLSYVLSIFIFVSTFVQSFMTKLYFMCLRLPIFNMSGAKPSDGERGFLRTFALSRCVFK